jgi:hypothetical protein
MKTSAAAETHRPLAPGPPAAPARTHDHIDWHFPEPLVEPEDFTD